MSSIARIRKASITNRPSGGGNKLSGLPPGIGGNIYAKRAWDRGAYVPIAKRNVVFCINQLGGIGHKSSSFISSADGVHCRDNAIIESERSEEDSVLDDNIVLQDIEPPSCNQIFNPPDDVYSNFGRSVSIDSSLCALVGCPNKGNAQINIYTVNDGSFTNTQTIVSNDTSFGWVVSKIIEISNTEKIFITGSPQWRSSQAMSTTCGAIQIYYSDDPDTLQFYPLNQFTITCEDVVNTTLHQENAQFGYSLSVVKDTSPGLETVRLYILVGEIGRTISDLPNAGAAYIFTLDINGPVNNSSSYNIDNGVQITGNGSNNGKYINAEEGAYFGYSVSLIQTESKDIYGTIGAPNSNNMKGSAYIFQYANGSFCIPNSDSNQTSGYISPETAIDASFGYSVFITNLKDERSGWRVVVGIGAIGGNRVWLYSVSTENVVYQIGVKINSSSQYNIDIYNNTSLQPYNIPQYAINTNMQFGSTIYIYNDSTINSNNDIIILISTNQSPFIYRYTNINFSINGSDYEFTFSQGQLNAIGYTGWTNQKNNTTFDVVDNSILLGIPQTNRAQYFNIDDCNTDSDSCNCLPSFNLNNLYTVFSANRNLNLVASTMLYKANSPCNNYLQINTYVDSIWYYGGIILSSPVIDSINSNIYYYPILKTSNPSPVNDNKIIQDQYIYKTDLSLSELTKSANTISLFEGGPDQDGLSITNEPILNDPKLYEIVPVIDSTYIYMLGYSYNDSGSDIMQLNNKIYYINRNDSEFSVNSLDLLNIFNSDDNTLSIDISFISVPAISQNENLTSSTLYITTDNNLLIIESSYSDNDDDITMTPVGNPNTICEAGIANYVTSPVISDVSSIDFVYYGSIDISNDTQNAVVLNIASYNSNDISINKIYVNSNLNTYNVISTPIVLTNSITNNDDNTITINETIYLTCYSDVSFSDMNHAYYNSTINIINVNYKISSDQTISDFYNVVDMEINTSSIVLPDNDTYLTTAPVIYYKPSNPINENTIVIYIGTNNGIYAYDSNGIELWNYLNFNTNSIIYTLTINNEGDIFCGIQGPPPSQTYPGYIGFDIYGNLLTDSSGNTINCSEITLSSYFQSQSSSVLNGCPRLSHSTCKLYS